MSNSLKVWRSWAILSLILNGLLLSLALIFILRPKHLVGQGRLFSRSGMSALAVQLGVQPPPTTELGPRHYLNYEQWVALLGREAQVAADQKPKRLTVLLGDSLSLWFPAELLPQERNWLNQGISGETSGGLLKRLDLIDQTQPETILVMIGINDLTQGAADQEVLDNQRQILQYLVQMHPRSQIVLQSILPHRGEQSAWEGRDRLKKTPNSRIRHLNRELKAIALELGANYLDLHPLFVDAEGNLRSELTSDGLHLSPRGYLVWASAIQLYGQLKLEDQS